MVRRLLFTLALVVASTVGLSGCHVHCEIVYLNGPDHHPPGAAYHADIQTWTTVVGGQIHIYGYSRTLDTTIYNDKECFPDGNLLPHLRRVVPFV